MKYLILLFILILPHWLFSQHLMSIQSSPLSVYINEAKKPNFHIEPSMKIDYLILNNKSGFGIDLSGSSLFAYSNEWQNSLQISIQRLAYKKFRHTVLIGLGTKFFLGKSKEIPKHPITNNISINTLLSPEISYLYTLKVKRRKQNPWLIKLQLAQAGTKSYALFFGITKFIKKYKGRSNCDCPDFAH